MRRLSGVFLLGLLSGIIGRALGCTTLAVGRAASSDGSVLLTHSDDAETNPDARLCYIAGAEHAKGSMRQIYFDKEDYPRFVGSGRGPCYVPQPGQAASRPIGEIPEVERTFAYLEASYGIVNEHNVGIGESTCSGRFGTNATGYGGKALLSIDSLSRIAMERSRSAREAVELIGSLAEEYGFYGAGSFEGTAESLMVGDPDEVYIFHILPDPTGKSAIWASQRVPDDHAAVVANMFVIREIDFDDHVNFLHSQSVRSVAEAKGWWRRGEPLDFTKIYSDGEYASKYYSGRRVWGAFRKWGVDLPTDYKDLRYDAVYPVTAKPSSPVKVPDLFAIHRDHYEGTQFDMTKGLAAGPWGDPDRFTTQSSSVKGNWERSIGLFRTSCTHVVQARREGQGSVLWFGPHATAGTVFFPLAVRSVSAVPAPYYAAADPNRLDRSNAYWAHRTVFNVAKIKYSHAMSDVKAAQAQLEAAGIDLVRLLDKADVANTTFFDAAYFKHAEKVTKTMWLLADTIVEKYADGWLNDSEPMGYPDWWLEKVGYRQGPPPPPSQPHFEQVGSGPVVLQREQPEDLVCGETDVKECVAACSREAFAACAAGCTRNCREEEGSVVVV